jgi:hypothetical protein
MVITITNNTTTLDIDYIGNGDQYSIYKANITLEKSGDYVVIVDSGRVPAKEYKVLYTDVIPLPASADELYSTLLSYVNSKGANSSTIVTQAVTTVNVEVLAANEGTVGASFVNLSNADAYILLGSGTASATNYTVKLKHGGDDIYETPYNYSGAVQVVFAHSGSGNLVITKFN